MNCRVLYTRNEIVILLSIVFLIDHSLLKLDQFPFYLEYYLHGNSFSPKHTIFCWISRFNITKILWQIWTCIKRWFALWYLPRAWLLAISKLYHSANIYLLKFRNRNIRQRWEIFSKLPLTLLISNLFHTFF